MMSEAKTVRNKHGTFVMTRQNQSFELLCDRCLEPKITKVEVTWTTPEGRAKRICNGCYGRLLSGVPL